ncbi:MAG: hypothetical protein A2939_02730 [Parcubacteria group bacterium RIFCSPLOWO2_01_FULL_48_18]|nr:MAG: hypothetical protein A2939_02730 [Parcubacteria group bacterium RIFCSPLOWO2_01_FULL_48_18]
MPQNYQQGLKNNIFAYYFFRIFNKRAYLPLIPVYAVSVAGLSLAEFGLVAAIASAVSLTLEIPSGYLSDRMGHKKALMLGHFIMALSPLAYIIWPNFSGILLGAAGYFGGFAFLSGTLEAFLHETLLELNREDEYSKIMGRTQAIGLLGNVVIISLIPLTYSINPRIPFLCGAFLLGISFLASLTLTTPRKTAKSVSELEKVSFPNLLRTLRQNKQQLLFLLLGVTAASANKIPDFREIYFQELGIPIPYFGFILALGSLLAAFASYNLHKIERIKENWYYGLSFTFLFLITTISGFVENQWLGIGFMVLLIIYGRNELMLAKSYLLRKSPTRELKATYLSLLAFAGALNGIWIPILLGYLATAYGIQRGYTYFGEIMFLVTGVLFIFFLRSQRK